MIITNKRIQGGTGYKIHIQTSIKCLHLSNEQFKNKIKETFHLQQSENGKKLGMNLMKCAIYIPKITKYCCNIRKRRN